MKSRREKSHATKESGMQATMHAHRANEAWRQTRRRRTTGAIVGTASDAATAAGGLVIANAALSLGIGLPSGIAGLALGASILAMGLAGFTGVGRLAGLKGLGRAPRPARSLTVFTTTLAREERSAA